MFSPNRLVSVPAALEAKLEVGFKFIFGALGVMFAGMILASIWQWIFNIESKTLMDSPIILQVMMLGGFIAFIIALVVTLIVLPIWYDLRRLWR